MTIRRQWLIGLTVTAVFAVFVNSVIFASLINRYFMSYNTDTYNNHVAQLVALAENALTDSSLTGQQVSVQFESHLDDPIVSIKLYNATGELVASAEDATRGGHNLMSSMMRRNTEEVDNFDVSDGSAALGVLHIIRYGSLNNSMVSMMFRASLLRNSAVSFGIVLTVLFFVGTFASRRLSRDLTNTASQALGIDMDTHTDYKPSKVREIRIIQAGLETLQNRLKIKQISRKRIVDELVHQTRTPLTILKTHLEGLEDGVITMTAEEISICQAQIDDISSIIANMSMVLDADRSVETLHTEEIDVQALLRQIMGGMKSQFEKKGLELQLLGSQKAVLETDKHKLSQCIYNLLTNAYKFTEPNGKVIISSEVSGASVSISIKDSGIGIDKEDLPHLFDAYYRGRSTKNISGDGLGLYVVKENLEQIGGRIDVKTVPGVGSEFILSLPKKIT